MKGITLVCGADRRLLESQEEEAANHRHFKSTDNGLGQVLALLRILRLREIKPKVTQLDSDFQVHAVHSLSP